MSLFCRAWKQGKKQKQLFSPTRPLLFSPIPNLTKANDNCSRIIPKQGSSSIQYLFGPRIFAKAFQWPFGYALVAHVIDGRQNVFVCQRLVAEKSFWLAKHKKYYFTMCLWWYCFDCRARTIARCVCSSWNTLGRKHMVRKSFQILARIGNPSCHCPRCEPHCLGRSNQVYLFWRTQSQFDQLHRMCFGCRKTLASLHGQVVFGDGCRQHVSRKCRPSLRHRKSQQDRIRKSIDLLGDRLWQGMHQEHYWGH
jgi:hypothetical protein